MDFRGTTIGALFLGAAALAGGCREHETDAPKSPYIVTTDFDTMTVTLRDPKEPGYEVRADYSRVFAEIDERVEVQVTRNGETQKVDLSDFGNISGDCTPAGILWNAAPADFAAVTRACREKAQRPWLETAKDALMVPVIPAP